MLDEEHLELFKQMPDVGLIYRHDNKHWQVSFNVDGAGYTIIEDLDPVIAIQRAHAHWVRMLRDKDTGG